MPHGSIPDLPAWVLTLLTGAVSGLAGFIMALVNRGPAMQAEVTKATATLIEGYERRIEELTEHIKRLETKIERLETRWFSKD